ncbi:MAG: hypothetical protein J5846_01010 [Desulfovibrio sp.]|nr:hypothetical protein [Desulfovibrio sp.]
MMKVLFTTLLACALCTGVAWAAEGDYVIKDGNVYRMDGGKEKRMEEDVHSILTEKGAYSWILVDPKLSEEMKGSEAGIYLFKGQENTPAGFIPMADAGICQLEFSPSAEKLTIGCGSEAKQNLGMYVIEEGKNITKKASFKSAGHVWWVDPHRFVFNIIDESKGARSKDEDDVWNSVVLYDSVEEELIIIKKATETEDYFCNGYNEEKGTLDAIERSVKNTKDWGDEKKIKITDITLSIPAAG